ncbi:hypothetical protein BIW11_00844 [Tropilaelaps mercedesae]|uniref:Uncharacterized protein n=1 Tax=Tropilaelaps mercedesae TaxID=418985 RepID=A0A1V9XNX3_9ACAR|nr:hypothetical protein BIW11_00844 [Tropilaelaps mercedesae]
MRRSRCLLKRARCSELASLKKTNSGLAVYELPQAVLKVLRMLRAYAVFGFLAAGVPRSTGKPDTDIANFLVPHCPKGLVLCTLDDMAFTPSKSVVQVPSGNFVPMIDFRQQVR